MSMRHAMNAILISVAVTFAVVSVPASAKTTDSSDLWWIPTESGWGIQFVQEENTIFATMFVYGPNRQPTWYVATMAKTPGKFVWSGTLYATTGPSFAAMPFDPN